MKVTAIKTRVMMPPKDDLWAVIKESVKTVSERSVVVVTSKVVAIHQGRCITRQFQSIKHPSITLRTGKFQNNKELFNFKKIKNEEQFKFELIKKEADWYLPMDEFEARSVPLTIKDGLLIPAAGIDVSNGNGYFVLWPTRVEEFCKDLWSFLRKEYGVNEVGVVVADSHVTPLRWGVTGIGLGYHGFKSLRDYSQQQDIFGRKSLTWVQAAVVDGVASAGVMVMGEGNEQTPMAIVEGLEEAEFGEKFGGGLELKEKARYDLFKPLVDEARWVKGGGGVTDEEVKKFNTVGG